MSPPEVWGPAVWTLFHTLAEKVNEQAYPFIKHQLFGQIRRICGFLPCPECSTDATNFLAKININDLKTKDDFRNMFYLFHNRVNSKKRRPLFNYSNLTSYNNYGIVPVINNFISKYNTNGNMKLLAESFQRKFVLNEFKSWFTKNVRAFIPPQQIHQAVPVSVVEEESTITTEDVVTLTEEVLENETTDTKEVVEQPFESEVVESEPLESEVVESETIESEVVESETIESEVVESEVLESETIESEVVESEVLESETIESEVVESETIESKEIVLQSKSKKNKKSKKKN